MSVILRENEWVSDFINMRSLGKKPSETLRRVARYYLDKGYDKNDVRNKLDEFLIQCEPTYSVPKWSASLDFALKQAIKRPSIDIDKIIITKPEMDQILSLSGIQTKRLAFTLLCLAKYWFIVAPQTNYWVSNKDSEIMAMANINTSIKRQSLMYYTLSREGFIKLSKKVDNTNVQVLFVTDGEPFMEVSDFRNLGYQFLRATGSNDYIECQNCGLVIKKQPAKASNVRNAGRNQKYCSECAIKIVSQQKSKSAFKRRGLATGLRGCEKN